MPESMPSRVKFIDREGRRIEVAMNQITAAFPLNAIPDPLYNEMASAMDGDYDPHDKLDMLWKSTCMKPTVCTYDPGLMFPINASTKILRLTLTDDVLEDKVEEIEGEVLSFQGHPFEETVQDRIDLYRRLFLKDSEIDRFRFGAAELYGDSTYSNIRRDPRASITFQWRDPSQAVHYSYQANCVAEIVFPGDPFYRFMRILRSLFSSRFIDLRRSEYLCAYKFYVCEVKDKSLVSRPGFALPED
ncbi:MAG: pyridoxamine 5'-phosphate oxidase family protein [Candidatus Thorarchaeota archaeon]|nr:pyridoxamine 5'-phosphate oxidase family protein [Candidatus Thorarchaeota archaeon]